MLAKSPSSLEMASRLVSELVNKRNRGSPISDPLPLQHVVQPVAARPQDAPQVQRGSGQIAPYLHAQRALRTAHRKLISQAAELAWRVGVIAFSAHDAAELARHLEREPRLAQHRLREDRGEAGPVGEGLPPERGAVRAVV